MNGRHEALTGWRAGLVWAVAVGAIAVTVGVLILTAAGSLPSTVKAPMLWLIVQALLVTSFGSMGALLATRVPDNRIGWILWSVALLISVASLSQAYAALSFADPVRALPIAAEVVWVGSLASTLVILLAIVYLSLLFPTGHIPSRRWRPVLWLAIVATLDLVILAFLPGPMKDELRLSNPFGLEIVGRLADPLNVVGGVMQLIVPLAALSAPVYRFRRGDPVEKQQVKWFASTVVLTAVTFVGSSVTSVVVPDAPWLGDSLWAAALTSLALLPIAIGIAILRYRLFEIDRVVSRTVGYAIVTAILLGTYTAVILLLTGPLGAIFGGDTISVAISTLVAAAAFQPLRRRVQRVVDRRFDRAHYDAERTAAAFSEQLRDQVDLATIKAEFDRSARRSIAPASVGIWLRGERERV